MISSKSIEADLNIAAIGDFICNFKGIFFSIVFLNSKFDPDESMTEVGDHHVIFYAVLDVGPSVCYKRKSPSSEYGSVGPRG